MQIRALHNTVIVRRDKAAETTAAGVLVPEMGRERPAMGTILAVGPGRTAEMTGTFVATEVKAGQRVVFPKYAGTPVPGLEDGLAMSERDLIMVLDEGDEIGVSAGG